MELRSKNPVLTRAESEVRGTSRTYITGTTATFGGIAIKSGILLAIIFGISLYIFMNIETLAPILGPMLTAALAIGFISVLVATLSRSATPVFTIIYAICEGVALGTLSAIVELAYPGIVFGAIVITFIIFGFLLVMYSTGVFKVGLGFRKFFLTALISILFFYFIEWILSLFHIYIINPNNLGLLLVISVIMVIMASFSLMIDFDDCRRAVDYGAPKNYEWYLSLGLLVSLVWLYTEVLRLLLIIARYTRDR